jgi:hypothetical protein
LKEWQQSQPDHINAEDQVNKKRLGVGKGIAGVILDFGFWILDCDQ